MGFLSTFFGILGFGIGIPLGLLVGFFLFIYSEAKDVKVINIYFSKIYSYSYYEHFLKHLITGYV
jgi:hypothetical protein